MERTEITDFGKSCRKVLALCGVFLVLAVVITFALPSQQNTEEKTTVAKVLEESDEEITADFGKLVEDTRLGASQSIEDVALALYRQPSSRSAVEWFYLHVTGSRETALPILEEAEKNDIPPSLAFALAYTESRYRTNAVNKNKNASIDRGLFQLNNRSFPQLTEEEFFDPRVSAKYGMSHLRFCMNIAGNEVSGLAMYNAGTTKVKQNNTPQSTLNYVGNIMAYRDRLDKLFAEEVLPYYDTTNRLSGVTVAYNGSRRSER